MTEKTKDTGFNKLMTNDRGPVEPGHDAWFRRAVRATLYKKAVGEMTYRSLDDVIARFGFDERLS